jgi:hypothetical protein
MLTALGLDPVTYQPRADAVTVPTRWLQEPPASQPTGERVQIALGVWIVRYRHWAAPGSLDTAAELPDLPDADPPLSRSPRYPTPGWKRRGLCSSLPLDLMDPLFFGTEDRQAPEDLIVAVETARRVCALCQVDSECLTYALTHDMRYGVWAGSSGRQREKMRTRIEAGETTVEKEVARWLG